MISAIVPTKCTRSRHGLSRLYLSLMSYNNVTSTDFEVVIVSNGCDWNMKDEISRWPLKYDYTVIDNPTEGMCSAYNRGVSECNGQYVFLGLDDTIVRDDTLVQHLAKGVDSDNQITIGKESYLLHTKYFYDVITGQPDDGADARAELGQAYDILRMDQWTIKPDQISTNTTLLDYLSVVPPTVNDLYNTLKDRSLIKMHWLAMRVGNHSLRKSLYQQVGGLDSKFDQYGGWYADIDFGLRLSRLGAEFQYVDEIKTYNLTHHKEINVAVAERAYKELMADHPFLEVALVPMYFAYGPQYTIRQFAIGVRKMAELTNARSIQL